MHNILDQGDKGLPVQNTEHTCHVDLSNCHDVRQAFPSHHRRESNHHSHCDNLDFNSDIYSNKQSKDQSQHDVEEELLQACQMLQTLLDEVKARIDTMQHQPQQEAPSVQTDSATPTRPIDAPSTTVSTSDNAVGSLGQVLVQNDKAQATTHAEGDTNSNVLNASRTESIPTGAKGISGWGLVTNEDGAQVDRSASVQIQNMQTYVHLKTGGWKLVENQNNAANESKIAGMTENTDFTNVQQDNNVSNNNGVATLEAPPGPYTMKHFGVANKSWTPGTFDENSIDGVFVRADAKANENNSGLIAKLGGEWWSNPGQTDNTILGVPGTNNFTKLTDQWQSMYFSSVDPAILENDPPPGIGNDTSPATRDGHAYASGSVADEWRRLQQQNEIDNSLSHRCTMA